MSMQKRYYLSQTERKLSGVCGGLSEYFDIDPLLVRLAFVALVLCGGGGVLIYILLALLAPNGPIPPSGNAGNTHTSYGSGNYDRG